MNNLNRGITLIELVAGLVALVILAAVLAPALADVRHRSKDAVCLQNLARIAQASIVYSAQDETEAAIPVHKTQFSVELAYATRVGTYMWGGKSSRGEVDSDKWWWGTKYARGPASRPLNKILYGDVFPEFRNCPGVPAKIHWRHDESLDLAVYRCPGDKGYVGGAHHAEFKEQGLTSFDHFGNSYAANVLWVWYAGSGYLYSNSPYLRRLSETVSPVETITYVENCGRYAHLADPQPCGEGEPGTVHGWHGRPWMFNAAFVDGHVAPARIKGMTSPHLGHYPDCPPGDDCYPMWHCVIMRGPGWRLDTLPIPPVPTQVPVRRGAPMVCGGQDGEALRAVPYRLGPP